MRLVLVFCTALIAFLPPVLAQYQPDLATDQELFAAYCLGQVQQHQVEYGAGFGRPEIDNTIKSLDADQAERFKAYLTARGFTGVRRNPANNAVELAERRGFADGKQCGMHTAACVKKCSGTQQQDRDKCTSDCRDLDRSCSMVHRCARDYQLPF